MNELDDEVPAWLKTRMGLLSSMASSLAGAGDLMLMPRSS